MLKIIIRHLFGQGFITLINVIVGILFIRWLSIEEFAIYALVTIVQTIAATFSDFGIANGVNTLTARLSPKESSLRLLTEAWRLRLRFLPFSIFSALGLGWILLSSHEEIGIRFLNLLLLSIICGLIQSKLTIAKSVFNARFQSDTLFRVGIIEAFTRLGFCFLVFFYPYVELAIVVNLCAICISYLTIQKSMPNFSSDSFSSAGIENQLKKFAFPLIPSTIYSLAQVHLGVFILSLIGTTQMIAEISALSRFSQIFSLILVLGPFWIQPFFARISSKNKFFKNLFLLVITMSIIFIVVIFSTYYYPWAWLWFLGDNYQGSDAELQFAIISSIIYLSNTCLYTIVLSRGATYGQSWTIIFGIAMQISFYFINGVLTTKDAILINTLPAISSLFVQIFIIGCLVFNKSYVWNKVDR